MVRLVALAVTWTTEPKDWVGLTCNGARDYQVLSDIYEEWNEKEQKGVNALKVNGTDVQSIINRIWRRLLDDPTLLLLAVAEKYQSSVSATTRKLTSRLTSSSRIFRS